MSPLFEFLLSPHYCGLGAGSIPFWAIVNEKPMRDDRVTYVAGHQLLSRCTRLQGVSASEMTDIVSLNSTHSPDTKSVFILQQ